jgi:hypothetical protein
MEIYPINRYVYIILPYQSILKEISIIFFLTLQLIGCILWHRKTKERYETLQGCFACKSKKECSPF